MVFTPNKNLYKWQTTDTKQTTITEISNNADKIDTVLKNHDDHLTANDGKIGDLASLKTADKSSLVNAFNEQGGRLDNIITNAGNSNPEIVDARGTFSALKDRLNNVDSSLSDISINVKIPFGTSLPKAKGDGITDDWAALQAIIDYAYDNGYKNFWPKGTYRISKPLTVYGESTDYQPKRTVIEGAGRDLTVIIKDNNNKVGEGYYSDIDAIMVIGNEYTKAKATGFYIYDNHSVAQKIYLSDFSLQSTSTIPVEYGIYSLGFYFSNFNKLGFRGMNTAMFSKVFNCFNNFDKLDVASKLVGFDFLTEIGGNTTMHFTDIHLNGLDEYGYKIKGGATFINCSHDGGLLQPYYFKRSSATLINCNGESPVAKGFVEATDQSSITMIDCGCETPMVGTSTVFKASGGSVIYTKLSGVSIAGRSEYPSTSPATLYSADKTSNVIFDRFTAKGEFDSPPNYPVSESEKKIIMDRNHLNTPFNKILSYVNGSVPPGNYAVITTDTINNRLNLSSSGSGVTAIGFQMPLSLDNYSRVKMVATLENLQTTKQIRLFLKNTLYADGFVSVDVDVANTPMSDVWWYDGVDYEFYVDITNVYGNYYVYVNFPTTAIVKIKEISLIR